MKKIWITLLAGCCVIPAFGQKLKAEQVPAAVKNKFASLYPAEKNPGWEKEEANYEAEFKTKGMETSVVFDSLGNVLETESEIKVSELPKAVTDAISKDYPGFEIEEASRVEAGGKITYEAELEKGDEEWMMIFGQDGTLLSKKNAKEEDKGKDDDDKDKDKDKNKNKKK